MTYHFGPFRYDAEQRLLFRGTERVALEPKAVDMLQVLLERRGHVIDKPELLKLVWPDVKVEDVGVARNICALRKALGDDSDANPWIETVPRRGYRFTAEVTTGGDPVPVKRHGRWPWLAVAIGVALAALVYYQFYVPSRYLPGGAGASLRVPFTCLCPGVDGEALAQGLNEVLVAELAGLGGLHVVSPSTVARHRRVGVSMGLMGRLLGLDALVEGTIQKLENDFRITLRLVDVHTGKLIWAKSYDKTGNDAGAVTAHEAAAEIRTRLTNSGRY